MGRFFYVPRHFEVIIQHFFIPLFHCLSHRAEDQAEARHQSKQSSQVGVAETRHPSEEEEEESSSTAWDSAVYSQQTTKDMERWGLSRPESA